MKVAKPIVFATLMAYALIAGSVTRAVAFDTIRAGKAISAVWTYTALDVGVDKGIFAKYGLDVQISMMPGSAKLQQAFVGGGLDFGLGPAFDMAFRTRGAPDIAVAAFAVGDWSEDVLIVPTDSPIKSVSDLKGKVLGVGSNGSLPEHIARRISTVAGWGPNGIRAAATGQFGATVAATMSHAVNGFIGATEAGLLLQERGRARVISIAEAVKLLPYQRSVVYAREDLVTQQPDVVKRFLQGLFASVDYVRKHKEKARRSERKF